MLAVPSQAALFPGPLTELPLYDLVASDGTLKVSPRTREGHDLVVDLLSRLGLLTHSAARRPVGSDADVLDDAFEVAAVNDPERPATANPVPPGDSTEETSSTPRRSKLLSEMVALNLKNLGRGKPKASSPVGPRRYILDLVMAAIGDKPMSDVSTDDADTVADLLEAWPRNLANHPELKGLSPKRVVARARMLKLPIIQRSTQKKHLQAIMAFFNWAVEAKEIEANPFRFIEGSRYRDDGAPKKERFSPQDLEAIFHRTHVARFTEPHKFWVPLIGLFSAMRVNEICQLFAADVQTETVVDPDGHRHEIAFFNISDAREGQSVKSVHSRRLIPIHSTLIKLGFLQYVADVRASGSVHLFPGLTWGQGGPGRVVSRWFNKHLRKRCGVLDKTKSLHSLRHTVTTHADRARVPDSIIRTINGHSPGEGVDRKTYVARGNLWECRNALESLPYPALDLEPYTPGRFAAYLQHTFAQYDQAIRLRSEDKPVVRKKGRPPTTRFTLAPIAPSG